VIPRSVRLSESPSHGLSVFEYEPKSAGAEGYRGLAAEIVARGEQIVERRNLNVKPAVGSTPPSAGVTPAPSDNRKMARTPFCSKVLFSLSPASCVIPSEAEGPRIFLDASRRIPTTDRAQCMILEPHSVLVSFRAKRRIPDLSRGLSR